MNLRKKLVLIIILLSALILVSLILDNSEIDPFIYFKF